MKKFDMKKFDMKKFDMKKFGMKKFDMKSLMAGILMGSLGITTVFAAAEIRSAQLSNTKITLNGEALPLSKPLVSVILNDEQDADLYVPINELLDKLGYTVQYCNENDAINLIPGNGSLQNAENHMVINLTNHTGQKNIAESGSFLAEDNQKLILMITSDIQGGTVDLFLFAPDGKEQRITIGAGNMTKEIALEKGIWQYNCSGIFSNGGNIKVVGEIQ